MTWITPKILHHSACHIERHMADICFRGFLLEWASVTFGRNMLFSVAGFLDSHEGFIYTNTEYSEMNSEGLIEHDHPSRAYENLAFNSSSQPFSS